MNTEQQPNDAEAHAALVDDVTREILAATAKFARDAQPGLSPGDVAVIYLRASAALAKAVLGPAGTAALLHRLGDWVAANAPAPN